MIFFFFPLSESALNIKYCLFIPPTYSRPPFFFVCVFWNSFLLPPHLKEEEKIGDGSLAQRLTLHHFLTAGHSCVPSLCKYINV